MTGSTGASRSRRRRRPPTARRVAAVLAGAALAAATLGGCTSSPQTLPALTASARPTPTSAPEVAAATIDAAKAAGPVHLTGSYTPPEDSASSASTHGASATQTDPSTAKPVPIKLDVRGTPTRFRATFDYAGVHLELIRVGDKVAARGSRDAALLLGRSEAASGWVRLAATEPALEPWLRLADAPGLIESALTGVDCSLEPGVNAATGGVPAHRQLDILDNSSIVGTVTVAASDDPVPLSIVAADATGTGTFAFADWGAPVEVALP